MIRIATAVTLLAVLTGCSDAGQPVSSEPQLTATLVSPIDITLDWKGLPADTSSTIVEFATEPDGRYTILDFVTPDKHTYQHPDLMPKTPFYYRVTPVSGPLATNVVVKPVGADGIRVTWTDDSTDEDGYLLEIKPQGQLQYRVAGFIDPNWTFTELSTLPSERGAAYQVRAFHRGAPSNLAHQTTGAG